MLATSVALVLLALAHEQVWHALGVLSMRPYFVDTAALLAAGEAKHAGLDPYLPNPLDPLGRPHVYGPLWLLTGAIGLKVSDTWCVGAALSFGFLIVVSFVLQPQTRRQAVFAVLAICSPPVLLAVNRANNDLVVFLLIVAGAWLLSRRSWLFASGGAALVGLAAVLKVYPVAALWIVAMRKGRWRTVALLAAVMVGCALLFWVSWSQFRTALALAPRPRMILTYGLNVSVLSGLLIHERAMLVVGWTVGSALVLFALVPRIRVIWRSVAGYGFSDLCLLGGASCWVLCFFANTNYHYRVVLLLPAFRQWLRSDHPAEPANAGRIQVELWLFTFWLALPKEWVWSQVADQVPADPAFMEALKLIIGVEQACLVWLTVAVAVAIAGAFFRRVETWRCEHA